MNSKKLIFILFSLVFLFNADYIYAQESGVGLSIPATIEGDEIPSGSIICSGKEGLKLCDLDYDSSVYAVVTKDSTLEIKTDSPNTYLLLSSGQAKVRVKGAVKKGDLITSSKDAGIGTAATKNGYVLGNSLEDFTPTSDGEIGQVYVYLNIHSTVAFADTRSNLFQILRQAVSSPVITPLSALRYILAAIVTIVSFVLGFLYFGRLAKTALEGISRNPLAQRTIQFTLVVHIIFTFIIFLGGLGIAYLILAL